MPMMHVHIWAAKVVHLQGPFELPQQQQDRPEAHPRHDPPSTPSHDYGSRAANDAAQKLESLGASVYPPEAKDTMDWGILAGKLRKNLQDGAFQDATAAEQELRVQAMRSRRP